jgi:transcriptional regulator PpsR
VTTAADLAIVLDTEGTVKSVITNPLNPTLGRLDHWKDRDIREFMAEDSLTKLETQLDAHREGQKAKVDAIEVNHYDNANWEFPIRYTIHKTGNPDIILMLGRDLRPIAELQHRLVKAQLALEKDYETHRDYETRYRVVMETTRDAFVLVDVASGRVLDLNTAAGRLLGDDPDVLAGKRFAQEFDGRRRGEFIEGLRLGRRGRGDGPGDGAGAPRPRPDITIEPIVFRAAGDKVLLCRIEASETAESVAADLSQDALAALSRRSRRHGLHRRCRHDPLRERGVPEPYGCRAVVGCEGQIAERVPVARKCRSEGHDRQRRRIGKMRLYSTRLEGAFGSQLVGGAFGDAHAGRRGLPLSCATPPGSR